MSVDIVLARAELPHIDGIAGDGVVNTFVIEGTGIDADADAICDAVAGFYNYTDTGSGNQLGSWIGGGIKRTADACRVDLYDITGHLDGSPHGSPIHGKTFTMSGSAGATSIPEECAVVLTLQADLSAGVPVSEPNPTPPPAFLRPLESHRGRIFVGPLTLTASAGLDSGDRVRVHTALIAMLGVTSLNLQNTLTAMGHDEVWAIWSRKLAAVFPVKDVLVDNAFDTQRRRGPKPTTRTTTGVL